MLPCLFLLFYAVGAYAADDWSGAVAEGNYDKAVQLAKTSPNELGNLIAQASEKRLAEKPMWRALLHYQPRFGGVKSQVDSPWFFQSENGKEDAEAELHATLAAFFHASARLPLRLSAYCRFVARRQWLTEQLGADMAGIPAQECPEFTQYVSYLNASTLTLVFPTSHPNSPASAFGHTLIRVDQANQSRDAKLLNMSINFAAEVPQGVGGTLYVFGGLAGKFPGKFRLLPYHIKLREYRQINNRDTWEYPLKLSQNQIDVILQHSYEMLIAEFDYFFFSENCSYHLLSLLDVAFADDPLASNFSLWTIPVDTVKVLDARGLIENEDFVPSNIRTLRERESQLSGDERDIALNATRNGLDSVTEALDALPEPRQALVLDTIGDYNRYSRLQNDNSPSGLSAAERSVLSRRSKLSVRTDPPKVLPPDLAPQLGHDTSRLSFSGQILEDDISRFELNYRAAYHDARDPSVAYGTRAAISLLSVSVARDNVDESVYLSEFTLFSIDSIEPRSQFFKPFSWRTSAVWRRNGANSNHRFTLTGGGGVAYRLKQITTAPIAFAFLEGDVLDDPALPQRASLQVGSRIGLHWFPKGRVGVGLEWQHRELLNRRRYDSTALLWASLSPSRNTALVLEAKQQNITGINSQSSLTAQWRWYF